MLVRDAAAGVEVFLMERSAHGMFGGLHVFPGGKVDDFDYERRWNALTHGPDDAAASGILGVDAGGLGYWVACIRECFEEAGVLLAKGPADESPGFHAADVRARFEAWRARLNAGESAALEAMCREEEICLDADQLAYVSHWITPVGQPRRYNTRFFVARVPPDQEALHDGFETIESAWIRPEDALDRFADGKLNLISPTFKNLEAIAGYSSTESLLEAKRLIDPATIPTILPRIVSGEGEQFAEALDVVGRGGRPTGS